MFDFDKIAELEKKYKKKAGFGAPTGVQPISIMPGGTQAPEQPAPQSLAALLKTANTQTRSQRPDTSASEKAEAEKRSQGKAMNAIGSFLSHMAGIQDGHQARARLGGLEPQKMPDISNLGAAMTGEADKLKAQREAQLAALAAQDAKTDKFNADAFARGLKASEFGAKRVDADRDFGLKSQGQQFDQAHKLAILDLDRENSKINNMIKAGQLSVSEGRLLLDQNKQKQKNIIDTMNARTGQARAATGQFDADTRRMALNQKAEQAADKQAAKNKPKTVDQLNSSDKSRYDNIQMAKKGLEGVEKAIKGGTQMWTLFGDNEFTANRDRAVEAIGRMQSGGAITEDEEAKFVRLLPTWGDSKEVRASKLKALKDEMDSRERTLLGGSGSTSPAPVKRKTTEPTDDDPITDQDAFDQYQ